MIAITAFAVQEFVSKVGVVDETPMFFKPLFWVSYAVTILRLGDHRRIMLDLFWSKIELELKKNRGYVLIYYIEAMYVVGRGSEGEVEMAMQRILSRSNYIANRNRGYNTILQTIYSIHLFRFYTNC